jgi:hypothetical protein
MPTTVANPSGDALISTALATRWVPCLPRYRVTFAAATGVTNVNGISQVKRFGHDGQIIGVRVHLASVHGCLDRERYAFRKVSRSALMVSASVVGMPCGKPL